MRSPLSLGLLVVSLSISACGALEAPPVSLSYRESLVGAGKIVQITNTSNEALTALEVSLEAPDGETRDFRQETLEGYGTFEIGWKKLGGWQIPLGTGVRVRAEGFALAFEGLLPEGDESE